METLIKILAPLNHAPKSGHHRGAEWMAAPLISVSLERKCMSMYPIDEYISRMNYRAENLMLLAWAYSSATEPAFP